MRRRSELVEGSTNALGSTNAFVTNAIATAKTTTTSPMTALKPRNAVVELTSTTTTPPTGSTGNTLAKASNALSDVGPNPIEQKIIAKASCKGYRKFNYNWNNKVADDKNNNQVSFVIPSGE